MKQSKREKEGVAEKVGRENGRACLCSSWLVGVWPDSGGLETEGKRACLSSRVQMLCLLKSGQQGE